MLTAQFFTPLLLLNSVNIILAGVEIIESTPGEATSFPYPPAILVDVSDGSKPYPPPTEKDNSKPNPSVVIVENEENSNDDSEEFPDINERQLDTEPYQAATPVEVIEPISVPAVEIVTEYHYTGLKPYPPAVEIVKPVNTYPYPAAVPVEVSDILKPYPAAIPIENKAPIVTEYHYTVNTISNPVITELEPILHPYPAASPVEPVIVEPLTYPYPAAVSVDSKPYPAAIPVETKAPIVTEYHYTVDTISKPVITEPEPILHPYPAASPVEPVIVEPLTYPYPAAVSVDLKPYPAAIAVENKAPIVTEYHYTVDTISKPVITEPEPILDPYPAPSPVEPVIVEPLTYPYPAAVSVDSKPYPAAIPVETKAPIVTEYHYTVDTISKPVITEPEPILYPYPAASPVEPVIVEPHTYPYPAAVSVDSKPYPAAIPVETKAPIVTEYHYTVDTISKPVITEPEPILDPYPAASPVEPVIVEPLTYPYPAAVSVDSKPYPAAIPVETKAPIVTEYHYTVDTISKPVITEPEPILYPYPAASPVEPVIVEPHTYPYPAAVSVDSKPYPAAIPVETKAPIVTEYHYTVDTISKPVITEPEPILYPYPAASPVEPVIVEPHTYPYPAAVSVDSKPYPAAIPVETKAPIVTEYHYTVDTISKPVITEPAPILYPYPAASPVEPVIVEPHTYPYPAAVSVDSKPYPAAIPVEHKEPIVTEYHYTANTIPKPIVVEHLPVLYPYSAVVPVEPQVSSIVIDSKPYPPAVSPVTTDHFTVGKPVAPPVVNPVITFPYPSPASVDVLEPHLVAPVTIIEKDDWKPYPPAVPIKIETTPIVVNNYDLLNTKPYPPALL